MTCWNGHIPRMNTEQMRQAVEAYYEAYQREFAQRLDASIFLHDKPWHREPPRPERKNPTGLHEARPGDKVNAIDVEFRQVR